MSEMRLATTARFTDGDLPAEFVFDPAHPMRVVLEFAPGTENPVRWEMARSLIEWGLWAPPAEPGGRGDVRLWRCHADKDCAHLWLRDRVDDWAAEFTVDHAPLARWLASTYEAVPRGAEDCGLTPAEMNAGIAALLEGAA